MRASNTEDWPARGASDAGRTRRRGASLSRILAALFVATPLLATPACDAAGTGDGAADGGASDDGDDGGSKRPTGAAACHDRYFSKLSQECELGECGDAMTCTSDFDCIACADRCKTDACSSDDDCESAYGELCDDVEWRCQPYITADDLRCAVYDPGDSRCGDGECTGEETCEDCAGDCGYCPGETPAMAPCDEDADCESGRCVGWCVITCASGWDCVGDGTGTWYGECILASDGGSYCFPSCSTTADCAIYPGTTCQRSTAEQAYESYVCALP